MLAAILEVFKVLSWSNAAFGDFIEFIDPKNLGIDITIVRFGGSIINLW